MSPTARRGLQPEPLAPRRPGLLSRFTPRGRYWLLRLQLGHPRWGPTRRRAGLRRVPTLVGQRLPSDAQIGRYLHQWPRFRRPAKRRPKGAGARPHPPQAGHQRWPVDFKLGIPWRDGTQVNLCTLRDPVGEACVGAYVFPAGRVGRRPGRVPGDPLRSALRRCFTRWGTRPAEVQTDGEPVFSDPAQDGFPGRCRLGVVGLGITPVTSRPGQPTEQAEVERCHRTVMDYAVAGHEGVGPDRLQALLEQAVDELAWQVPSRADGCPGRPLVQAHPEWLQPRRPFRPDPEAVTFDLARVDAFLAAGTWERQVSATGQICLGGHHHYYGVGRAYAGPRVRVRFDPADRHFTFHAPHPPEHEIGRRPARHLAVWPLGPGPQQLRLPLVFEAGVSCKGASRGTNIRATTASVTDARGRGARPPSVIASARLAPRTHASTWASNGPLRETALRKRRSSADRTRTSGRKRTNALRSVSVRS